MDLQLVRHDYLSQYMHNEGYVNLRRHFCWLYHPDVVEAPPGPQPCTLYKAFPVVNRSL